MLKRKTTTIIILILSVWGFSNGIIIKNTKAKEKSTQLMIEKIDFFQNKEQQAQIHSLDNTVYLKNPSEKTQIRITGFVFGEKEISKISSLITPEYDQNISNITLNDKKSFTFSIWSQLEKGKNTLSIQAISKGKPIDKANDHYSFLIKNASEKPTILSIFIDNTLIKDFGWILILIIIISFIIWKIIISKTYKKVGVWILIIETLFISGYIGRQYLKNLLENELISLNTRKEIQIIDKNNPGTQITMTQMDENLNLKPGISNSWSNIEPNIWEFQLRKSSNNLKAKDIIKGMQELKTSENQIPYLSSVKHIISINDNTLQYITKYPDPLLAQKLSKVNIPLKRTNLRKKYDFLRYTEKERYDNKNILIKNENFYDKNSGKNSIEKEISIVTKNEELQKKVIKDKKIQKFENPSPGLWPTLFQNKYNILPKINSESSFLLIKKENESSLSNQFIDNLKNILHGGALLQTSYFQYGQLAKQFAPPGVTGYDPKLQEKAVEKPKKLDITEELTLMIPTDEQNLGKSIENILRKNGLKIQSFTYKPENIAEKIEKINPDILLVSIDFELGDVGPFYDSLIDSTSPLSRYLNNEKAKKLIKTSRKELNHVKRLKQLQKIMQIIVNKDPIGIPLIFKRSFQAEKISQEDTNILNKILYFIIFGKYAK